MYSAIFPSSSSLKKAAYATTAAVNVIDDKQARISLEVGRKKNLMMEIEGI